MNNLKSIRESAAMTQKELADLSGVNVRSIQAYESGLRDLSGASVSVVYSLARALGCKIEELIGQEPL